MPSAEYQRYMQSPEWQAKSRFVRERAKWRCWVCRDWYKTKGFKLTVHHLTYDRLGHEAPGDLVPLCERHHVKGRCGKDTLWMMWACFWASRFALWWLRLPYELLVLALAQLRRDK